MNTLPTETVDAMHHGSTGSDQPGREPSRRTPNDLGGIRCSVCGVGCGGQEAKIWNLDRQLSRPADQASRHKVVDALRRTAARAAIPGRTISGRDFGATNEQPHGQNMTVPVLPHSFAGYQSAGYPSNPSLYQTAPGAMRPGTLFSSLGSATSPQPQFSGFIGHFQQADTTADATATAAEDFMRMMRKQQSGATSKQ